MRGGIFSSQCWHFIGLIYYCYHITIIIIVVIVMLLTLSCSYWLAVHSDFCSQHPVGVGPACRERVRLFRLSANSQKYVTILAGLFVLCMLKFVKSNMEQNC